MTCTATSSPTRRAAAAPASVAALTAPTSPRTITVTYPAPIYSLPIRTTLAALTIASAASMEPTNPLVSIIPKASLAMRSSLAFPPTESVPAISNEFCNPGVRVARVEPSTAPKANQAGWEHLWKTSAASGRRTQENLERGSPLPLFSGARNRRAGLSEVKKQIPRGVYPAPGGARNDNQKHFLGKLLSDREQAKVGHSDPIASGILHHIHGLVGQVQQLRLGSGIGGIGGHADAGGNTDVKVLRLEPSAFPDQAMQATRDHDGAFLGSLRQQQHELVAAIAKGKVDQPAVRLDLLADLGEQLRAHQVPESVVDLLEMVEIDEDQREFVVVALGAVNLRFQDEIQVARVVKAGAVVGDRELMNSLDMPGVLERNGSKVGQGFQQRQVAALEAIRPHAIDQFNHAQAAVAEAHWDGHNGLRLHHGLLIHLGKETRVLAHVGHDHLLAVLRHPAGDALPHLDADVFEGLRSLAHGQLEVELLLGLIHQQQRPGVRPEKLIDFFHDGAENLVELEEIGRAS